MVLTHEGGSTAFSTSGLLKHAHRVDKYAYRQTIFSPVSPVLGFEYGVNGSEVPVPVGQVWLSWVPTSHTFS